MAGQTEKTGVIIPAAGAGSRMATAQPKQFLLLSKIPILIHTISAFFKVKEISWLVIPVQKQYQQFTHDLLTSHLTPEEIRKIIITGGGASRQLSVSSGLRAMPEEVDIILVHDAARPLIKKSIIKKIISKTIDHGAVIVALEVKDTLKKVEQNIIITTVNRKTLFRAQTPQAGRRHLLEKAFKLAEKDDFCGSDEASLFEYAGIPVYIIAGEEQNLKITRADDLELAAHILAGRKTKKEKKRKTKMRIGHGFDAHRLVQGRDLILGGEKIEFHLGLAGHSDADTLCHALMDAILGAMGEGDIGRHFPDSDQQYQGADSLQLLDKVITLGEEKKIYLHNADLTIICQKPKLAPYLKKMTLNLAKTCKISPDNINVKATTTEEMGYTGRGEGISCHAVVLMEQKICK